MLKKTCLKVSYVLNFPFVNPNGTTISGADYRFVKTIQSKLGFQFKIKFEPTVGRLPDSNNSYVGLFASVSYRYGSTSSVPERYYTDI
jgi:hypothetical protein